MSPIYLPLYADAEYTNPEETPNHLFEQPIEINGKYNFIEYNPGHPEEGIIPQYIENQEEEEIEDYDLYINIPTNVGGLIVNYIKLKVFSLITYVSTFVNIVENTTNWNFSNNYENINVNHGDEIVSIMKSNDENLYYISYLQDYGNTAGQWYTNPNMWYYIHNVNDENSSILNIEFENENQDVLFEFNDRSNDNNNNTIRINCDYLSFNIPWMTFN